MPSAMTTKTTPTLFGIPNCDSVRKARRWLADRHIAYTFVDVRETPPRTEQVAHWVTELGASRMVNKRSTTWKNLTDTEREQALSGDTVAVLRANPTLIKRPVLECGNVLEVGFDADIYDAHFQPTTL